MSSTLYVLLYLASNYFYIIVCGHSLLRHLYVTLIMTLHFCATVNKLRFVLIITPKNWRRISFVYHISLCGFTWLKPACKLWICWWSFVCLFCTLHITTTYVVIIWLVNAFCCTLYYMKVIIFFFLWFCQEQKCNFCLYKRKLEILTDRLFYIVRL